MSMKQEPATNGSRIPTPIRSFNSIALLVARVRRFARKRPKME